MLKCNILLVNKFSFQEIEIFTHVIVGNLDACVFRYLLLICDLIDRVDWRHVDDFKAFASNIYQFLNVSMMLTEALNGGWGGEGEGRSCSKKEKCIFLSSFG